MLDRPIRTVVSFTSMRNSRDPRQNRSRWGMFPPQGMMLQTNPSTR